MGYGSESRHGQVTVDAALLAAVALQTPGDKGIVHVLAPVSVLRFGCLITTATTGVIAVAALDKRVTYGSDTGRVELGRLNIPIGTALGKTVYKDVIADVAPGEQLVIELITASTAGGGIFSVEYIPRADQPASMVLSA
jgi:hypothetical protein